MKVRTMNHRAAGALVPILLLPALLLAGSNPKQAVAVRTPVPPRIDGVLDEPEWRLARPEREFTQRDPNEGAPGTFPTEIRILYDDEAVYFGCMMYDPEPSKIVARLARRDDEIVSDVISIRLDTYHDHQTAFEFTVNAAGVKVDILQYSDAQYEDASWDVVWSVETRVTDEGWVAEVKIPYTALRFPERELHEWGLQIIRRIARLNEQQQWVLIRKRESGFVSKFGHLIGIEGIRSPSNVQLIPYAVGSGRFIRKSPQFPNGRDYTSDVGFDLKYQPGSGITIDATINPDFGQVEADPAVLNLTTIETFYPEKRPFFIEGSQIIRFTTFGGEFGPGLFYSRRIGRAIHVEPPAGGHILEEPRTATILGAAKISGRTTGGLSVGVLEAVTREESAVLADSAGGRSERVVEPLTNFGLVRLRQDLLENSNVGMIVTSVNRDGRLPAMTAGIDWNLKFDRSTYRIDGFLAGSRTTDPFGGRIEGSAGKLNFSKDGGPHWRWFVSTDFTTKQYNINDIGFFRRPNDYGWVAQLLFRDDEVTAFKRIWNASIFHHLRRNFDGAELFNNVNLAGYIMFPSYWELDVKAEFDFGKYDDRESRGFGLYRKPAAQSVSLQLESDSRRPIVGELRVTLGRDGRRAQYASFATELEVKPASNLTLEFELARNYRGREFAWVGSATLTDVFDQPAESFAVFAERTTVDWDLTARGSFVFTRDLTLQMYLQLFFAKGTFESYHRMRAPDRFDPYPSFARPDFNRLSFNSNLVLRWEYLPGSTLFLVWSQARNGEAGDYRTPLRNDFGNTFALPAENVVLLKISYWLSM